MTNQGNDDKGDDEQRGWQTKGWQSRRGEGLIAALVHAGDEVVPGQAVFVEGGPEESEAEGAGGEHEGKDAAAHCGAGGVFVAEGAEGDAGAAHSGSGLGE